MATRGVIAVSTGRDEDGDAGPGSLVGRWIGQSRAPAPEAAVQEDQIEPNGEWQPRRQIEKVRRAS